MNFCANVRHVYASRLKRNYDKRFPQFLSREQQQKKNYKQLEEMF